MLIYLYWNNVRTQIRLVDCRSLMSLRLCMSVSDMSSIKHVYRSLIRLVIVDLQPSMSVSDESLIRDVGLRWVSDEACRGLPSYMSVSDTNNIFVNSKNSSYICYYRRPIGNPSEKDMRERRPIGDLDMLHRRP